MGSIQSVSGIVVGVGLGAVVGVAVGDTSVAGSEEEVGGSAGEDADKGRQAPSKILISTNMLTRMKGTDLEPGDLSIHPPKKIILHTMVRHWFRKALHETIDRSAEDSHKPGAQSKGLFSAALAGVAGGCLLALFKDLPVINFDMYRKRLGGNLNQVDILIAADLARIFAQKAHPKYSYLGARFWHGVVIKARERLGIGCL